MKTTAVCYPFDAFGSGGTGVGPQLLADELREILADNRRERVPTRAQAYQDQVRIHECKFETLADVQNWRQEGRRVARRIWQRGDLLLWLAGNHLGVLPVYDELSEVSQGTVIVQFDAHLDIHNFSTCTSAPSHGNFVVLCAGPLPHLINIGQRELLLPADHVAKYYQRAFAATELADDPDPALRHVKKACRQAKRVFIDIDCDVLDQAYFPAITHPVPFGMSPTLLLRFLDAIWKDNVVGLAISEYDPGRDRNDQSLATLAWLIEHLLLKRYE